MSTIEVFTLKEELYNGMAICLKPKTASIITVNLINELRQLQNSIVEDFLNKKWQDFFTLVWYLDKSICTKMHGLDYNYIYHCLKNNHDSGIEDYINKIIDVLFLNYINLGLPVINCSIVNHLVNGVFREFFLLNRYCFIRNRQGQDFNCIDIGDELKYLVFPKEIYSYNNYYYFNVFSPEEIRKIIMDTEIKPPNPLELSAIKQKFDAVRDQTINKIYETASKKFKVIERLAGV